MLLLKAILISFIINIFTIQSTSLENVEKNVSGIVKPILNEINDMYASSTTIKIPSNKITTLYQKLFKRSLKEKQGVKKNISTVVLYGNLADLFAFSRNILNPESELSGIQKILKRTDDETTVAPSQSEVTSGSETKNEDTEDDGPTKKLNKEDLHIGNLVEDHLAESDLVFVEVPIKKISNVANVSDETFEGMGDVIPDRLDFDHQRVFCGKEAVEKIEQNAHESTTSINGISTSENNTICRL